MIVYDAVMRQAQAPVASVYGSRPQPQLSESEAMEAAERALALLELEELQRPANVKALVKDAKTQIDELLSWPMIERDLNLKDTQAPPGLDLPAPWRGGTPDIGDVVLSRAAGGGGGDAAKQHEVRMLLQRMEAKGATTLMVRNLPTQMTQEHLVQRLTEVGFAGTFDFVYMPTNVATGEGNGYGFINFSSWPGLQRFAREWHGKPFFLEPDGDAHLSVSIATLQGKEANVNMLNTSRLKRVRNPLLKPIVFPDPHCGIAGQSEGRQRAFGQGERERKQPKSVASSAAPR